MLCKSHFFGLPEDIVSLDWFMSRVNIEIVGNRISIFVVAKFEVHHAEFIQE